MYNFNPEESYGIVAGASSEEDKGFVYIFGDANKKYSKDDYHGLF
jgi:hypothetical protein